MRRPLHVSPTRARIGLVALLALVVAVPGVIAARDRTSPVAAAARTAVTRSTAAARTMLKAPEPVVHPAWYGLQLVGEQPPLHEAATPQPRPAIAAAGGILIDARSGNILWQQNPHAALPPASTTKILTALLTLRNFDPQRLVTVTPEALNEQYDETLMGLVNGEKLTIEELLTGALLVSGNDAANTLAVDTVGMESFVAGMNAQVAALGLQDSHFVSPVGLDDPGQRASAYDLAVIARAAVTHYPLFRSIVAMQAATLPASANHHEFDLTNLNDELLRSYPGAVGIKPGWTGDAGSCLVGMATRDGHDLISVLLNAPLPTTHTRELLDWGFVQEGLPSALPPPAPPPAPAAPPPRTSAAHRTR